MFKEEHMDRKDTVTKGEWAVHMDLNISQTSLEEVKENYEKWLTNMKV